MNSEHPKSEQLTAFLHGILNDAEQESVAEHVAECDTCCQALREIPDDAFLGQLRAVGAPGAQDAADQDQLPKELRDHPRYKIGKFLGAGGMGLVYKAEHRLMGRIVALKIIHSDLIRHPRVVHRFHQEVKAAARLSHPNIVAAYDAEQAGDMHLLVMEFVDGVSLDRLVQKRGPLDVVFACNFIRQAAKGLQHAADAGMVHRDIKPQNLMLTKKGQIKILDFGLARLASESRAELGMPEGIAAPGVTKLGDIMGTPDFMAPEQAMDSSQADIRADIYSLGCTFYYLLAGHPPFVGSTAKAKIQAQRYQHPLAITKVRDDVPAEVASILDKMLAKDVTERYQTPAEVERALLSFGRPAPASTPPKAKPQPARPAPPERSETPLRRSRSSVVCCPFCQAQVRISRSALGSSLPCPKCSSYFTAIAEEGDSGKR